MFFALGPREPTHRLVGKGAQDFGLPTTVPEMSLPISGTAEQPSSSSGVDAAGHSGRNSESPWDFSGIDASSLSRKGMQVGGNRDDLHDTNSQSNLM